MQKYLLIAAKFLSIAYIVLCLVLWRTQSKLIFFPDSTVRDTPASLGLLYEEITLPVGEGDGEGNLHGWWIPTLRQRVSQSKVSQSKVNQPHTNQSNVNQSRAKPAPTVLYLHGNGSNIGDLISRAAQFHQIGCNVLLFDYRGYGLSSGPFPNERRVYEDAETAWKYLTTQLNLSANSIVIYGRSLGGAIALNLATEHPEAAATITEATFTSMKDMVKHSYSFFPFPTQLLLTNRFESLQKVRSLQMPLLFIHGTADRVVPTYMSQQLHQAATATRQKQLLLIDSGSHDDLPTIGGDNYINAVKSFANPKLL